MQSQRATIRSRLSRSDSSLTSHSFLIWHWCYSFRHGDVKPIRKPTSFLCADWHKHLFTGRKNILCFQALSAFRCFFSKKETKYQKYSSFQQRKQTDKILELPNGFALKTSLIVLRSSIDQAGLISLLMYGFISRRPSPPQGSLYSKNASLTFWRRNYFFLILAHPVYKMWIIQEPNTLELWKNCILKRKNWEYIPCLKYSVPIFVE